MIAVREVQPAEAGGVVYVELDLDGRRVARLTRSEAAELAARIDELVERSR